MSSGSRSAGDGAAAADGPTGTGSAASSGSASDSDGSASATPSTGIFPPVMDPGVAGPFTPTTTNGTGPRGNYTAIYPSELGQGGVKNPIVIWGDGAVLTPSSYTTLLNHLASNGFAILAYNATPQGSDMTAAIDWMISEASRNGSVFYGKIDTTKIAAMGHSAGSLATFAIANDKRLTTTMHLDGGTMSPHTDEMNLVKPAAFICGDSGGDGLITGDVARPNCDVDFKNATTPVWYGDVIGASHLTVTGTSATDPKLKAFLTATTGWLRWQLAADQTMKALFVPSMTCTLCTQTSVWTVQEKDLQ
jgi:chlorophyllase-like protein